MYLAATVDALGDGSLVQFWDEGVALDAREERTFEVMLDKLAATVKMSLIWTDPPDETLQNDLVLIVNTAKGTIRDGNARGSTKTFDRRNNVEQVVMTTVLPGKLSITARAYRAAIVP